MESQAELNRAKRQETEAKTAKLLAETKAQQVETMQKALQVAMETGALDEALSRAAEAGAERAIAAVMNMQAV